MKYVLRTKEGKIVATYHTEKEARIDMDIINKEARMFQRMVTPERLQETDSWYDQ